MKNLLGSVVGNEIFFVYTLIILVVIFIILIILIDKKSSKKTTQNLFDTLNMKIIANPDEVKRDTIKEENTNIDIKTINNIKEKNKEFPDLEPIKQVEIIGVEENLKEVIKEIEEEPYIETELEKTQAQIRVEEITKALEKADLDGKIEKDKYEIFEEEQEKNAIISYNELMKSYDKLYSENEKIQYLEDDEIPINIEELYKIQDKEKEIKKVEMEDFITIKEKIDDEKPKTVDSTFKSSPYISPVYGIQTPPIEVKKQHDNDIENANQFLQSLKELKNNLD